MKKFATRKKGNLPYPRGFEIFHFLCFGDVSRFRVGEFRPPHSVDLQVVGVFGRVLCSAEHRDRIIRRDRVLQIRPAIFRDEHEIRRPDALRQRRAFGDVDGASYACKRIKYLQNTPAACKFPYI